MSESTTYWKSKTNKGRVVYNRKKHYFRCIDCLHIIYRMMNNKSDEWYIGQAVTIRTMKQVIHHGYWNRVRHIFEHEPEGWSQDYFREFIQRLFRAVSWELCKTIMKSMGVPLWMVDTFAKWFHDWYYDWLTKLLDPGQ